ncbi:hypothetical protein ACFQH3_13780 [Haladaptatus sp. GCM10025707]|uniref:hypothetical protein n=1 Tax=unclassified Haladaptatus TaxID=2622732 RepID=UPI0023E8A611|nr:hypothetical protein [Haladaptatus sp. QDMS2]
MNGDISDDAVRAAFSDAMDYFHDQLNRPVVENDGTIGEEAEAYFTQERGWNRETITEKRLGWAPIDEAALRDHLFEQGHPRAAILATGLFYEELTPHFRGRYVFPYFDAENRPVYAISRSADHPADPKADQKYTKCISRKDYSHVTEPIFGLGSLQVDTPVIITEGIADAITAHQYGYPCISPVTKQFKDDHHEPLLDILRRWDVPRVYIVQDAERPESTLGKNAEERGLKALHIPQLGAGEEGSLRTAAALDSVADWGLDVRLGHLPRLGLDKVDLDDYLHWMNGSLGAVLCSAKPAREHPSYAEVSAQFNQGTQPQDAEGDPEVTRIENSTGHFRVGDTSNSSSGEDTVSLSVYDVLSREEYPEGKRRPHPFHGSSTGSNFHVYPGGETWQCWREGHDCAGNAYHLIGVEQGIISCGEWTTDSLETETWREIFSAARAAGYDLPTTDTETVPRAVLPADSGEGKWGGIRPDDRHAEDDSLSLNAVRDRTSKALADVLRGGSQALFHALPGAGKTSGSIAAAAETNTPLTLLLPRGNREQYREAREWADQHHLTHFTLPSAHRDCPTFTGEHGENWRERVRDLHARGVPPVALHTHAEQWFGRPLPCNEDGACPYSVEWEFDSDAYGVLLGHYGHAYVPTVVAGRAVAIDEFPEQAFTTSFSDDPAVAGPPDDPVVNAYLREQPALPFADIADLDAALTDPNRAAEVADALTWFATNGLRDDPAHAASSKSGHALAAHATFVRLATGADADALSDLDIECQACGDGWWRVTLPNDEGYAVVGATNSGHRAVHIHRPPVFDYATALLALDGTPTHGMWEDVLDTDLTTRQVLIDDECAEYVRDTLGLRVIQTTKNAHPVSSSEHVSPKDAAALFDEIRATHDQTPRVITSRNACKALQNADEELFPDDLLPDYLRGSDPDGGGRWYGDLLGSNRHKQARLGVVYGSRHYGDAYVKFWTALAGESVVTPDRSDPDARGMGLSYGDYGDRVLRHMREHQTVQAVLRFGRDGDGATVYVHTGALPDWFPICAEGHIVRTRSDGERAVLDACRDLAKTHPGDWTRADVSSHSAVTISDRQVRTHLARLAELGVLNRRVEGRGYVYLANGLHRVNDHGQVELPVLDDTHPDADPASRYSLGSQVAPETRF